MLLSMTGFGRAFGVFQQKKISVEIKALNSKGLDLNYKIHQNYKEIEAQIRSIVIQQLERGKIDLVINVENIELSKYNTINTTLAEAYVKELKFINKKIGVSEINYDYLPIIIQMPNIFINEHEQLSVEERNFVIEVINEACEQLIEFRKQEGIVLENDFKERIKCIQNLLQKIEPYEQTRVEAIREKLVSKLNELKFVSYDYNRLEQELIYYIERLDISEEKTRLRNHLKYFLETLITNNAGKKLGFITQEIGREINTLGSKSNHMEIQKIVIDMKDNLEKIKEQIANVL